VDRVVDMSEPFILREVVGKGEMQIVQLCGLLCQDLCQRNRALFDGASFMLCLSGVHRGHCGNGHLIRRYVSTAYLAPTIHGETVPADLTSIGINEWCDPHL
jgi:hypothetical protein